jgi:hypothetical protein
MSTFSQTSVRPAFLEIKMKAGVWSGDVEPTSYFDPVNFTKLEITPVKQDVMRVMSNMHGSIGESLDTQYKASEPATMSAELNAFNEELAAIILGSEVSDSNQTGTTVTDLPITTALNIWVKLPDQQLASTGFELNTTDATPVLIDAAKYEVDIMNGLIKAIHADAVGDMTVTYDTVTTTGGRKFASGKAKVTNLQLIGYALDKTANQYGILKIHKMSVVSSQAMDLAATDFMKGTLTGDLITPIGFTSPWEFTPYA